MAFIGIMLMSFIFLILLGIFILFIISLICFIIFSILSHKDKTKKSKKILKIVFGVLTVACLIPLLLTSLFLSRKQGEKIVYNGKEYSVSKDIVSDFFSEIIVCDTQELDKFLSKYPELINSKDFEGSLPLGYSIKYKKLDSIKYFVEKGVDINSVSNEGRFGTLEYMFYYNYYDEDILEFFLMQDDLDVNKRHLAMPVAQLYIKSIIKDKEISDKELELFQKLLDKGLDLNLTNGSNTNTYEYVKSSVSDEVVNVDKLRNIIEASKEK